MQQIKLKETVIVSDPCYKKGTWCQIKLNVKPGVYNIYPKKLDFYDGEDKRNSMLFAVHEDYAKSKLTWKEYKGVLGVDSGQCGIFSEETYRNDNAEITTDPILLSEISECLKLFGENNTEGEKWYRRMCSLIWTKQAGVETYPEGVVSHSGFGDGSYKLYVAEKYNKVVAMCIDYAIDESEVIDFTLPALD
jgi:hypothetical protein